MNFTRAFIHVHTLKGEWRSTVNLVNVNMYSVFCTLISSKMYKGLQMVVVVWLWQLCIKRTVDHPCPAPALPPGGETCPPARSSSSQVRTWRWNCFFLKSAEDERYGGLGNNRVRISNGWGAEDNRLAAQSQSAAHQCSLPRLPLHRNMRMVIGLVTEFFSKQCLFCKTFLTTSNLLCIRPEHSKGTRHNFNSGYLLLPFTDCFQSTAE